MDINELYQEAVSAITSLISINAHRDPVFLPCAFASETYVTAVSAHTADGAKNNQRCLILPGLHSAPLLSLSNI